jgi:Baseplate J-like protein
MTTPPPPRDRRRQLLEQGASLGLNGIDYVDVAADQTSLFVYFLNGVTVPGSPDGLVATITGGPAATTVAIADPANWSTDSEGRQVLTLAVAGPGDYSTYTLTIASPRLDPFFQSVSFTFQAACPTTLDSASPAPGAPGPVVEQVPIDYLAKDFGSFRQALSEFSTSRYPAWVERSEADLGMVLMEALAAMADELSYYQDRVSAESTIQTATQRLSVLRHARLVDYEPAPATTATTVLQLDVNSPLAGTSWMIDTPLLFQAVGADGSAIYFEIGDPATGLAVPAGSAPAWATVDTRWNRASLHPYYWDDSQRTLPAGSTKFYLAGEGLGLYSGQQLLLDTSAATSADPPVRELVTVSAAGNPTQDQLFGQLVTPVFLAAPTTANHDLSLTVVAGNIVPAVHGMRQAESFSIPGPTEGPSGPVVVRAAANQTLGDIAPDFRYCLASGPLAWLAVPDQGQGTPTPARPEIVLTPAGARPWTFQHWLLGAGPSDQMYTLTPEQYSPVLTSGGRTWYDYDGDGGTTIRFGDGTFGASPPPGTSFTVLYRVGGGSVGNVPADTIVTVAPGQPQAAAISACTNPYPASGGTDAETIAQVRARAPRSFRAGPLRAVQPADYVAAAQSLPWVQQAGTTFRWTGSWLTVLTSANPAGAEEPTIAQFASLTGLLNQRRLAGYESYVLPPRYVSIDLQITVCGQPTAFAGHVQAAVLARLQPGSLPGGEVGFFDHSRWDFGQPLESSALLAAVQSCPGVAGVIDILYRQRGLNLGWAPLPDTLTVAADQILRVDNAPARLDAGSLQVTAEGAR